MLKSYLQKNFGYNEPIFINELSIDGLSTNAIRQSVKRLTANGFLKRYDTGIYYIPKTDLLLGSSYLDPYLVIMRKFIRNKKETYGYITGISFANQIGLTTQMPAIIEIVTNRESTAGRTITVGSQAVHLKKSSMEITTSNAALLQLLDTISQAEKYTELTMEDTIETLNSYIRKNGFSKEDLSSVSGALTGATAKKMIEWGTIYEFTSK